MKTSYPESQGLKLFFLLCFFLSGACGLIYQVAWLRVLTVVFGNTTFATSTILSSYMAGLGLGALYFGNRIDAERRHPVRIYAWLEGGVALYALLTPLLWLAIESVHIGFYRALNPGFLPFALFKFALAFAALFIPTFLMGGTLPVVAKFFVSRREDTARYVGLLYGLNTFGAVFGVVFAGFYALFHLGVWQTVYLAGAINLVIFLALNGYGKAPERDASLEGGAAKPAPGKRETSGTASRRSPMMTVMLFLFGCSGAVSMMYEIGWTRILAIVLGSSTYAFSVMLATFLLGIAIGSYLFSLAAKRWPMDFFAFSVMQLLTSAAVLWGINRFDDIPFWFVQVFSFSKGSPWIMELGRFVICSAVMLGPTVLIGALFTCFVHAYRGSGRLGRDVGVAYFSNTLGTILGAALTGFVIVPAIGIHKTLLLGAAVNASIGVLSFVPMRENRFKKRLITAGAAFALTLFAALRVEPWNMMVIASDTAVMPSKVAGLTRTQFLNSFGEREILFYKEGLSATVSVARVRDNVSLAVNGKVDASNNDAFTQYFLGHLPLILHENPKKVGVIGLGSGSTLAAVAAHPVERIDSVELEKAVVEGSAFFRDLNRGVLEDPRVRQFVNDGRNFFRVSPDTYDVIISEPSNPWMAGVANLFSLEHFRTMKSRLNEGGIVCQWLHAYSMSTDDLAMIIKTFTEAFPYVQLWTSYYPDLMMVGFLEPRKIDLERVRKAFENPLVIRDLSPHGIRSAESFFSSFWLDDAALRALARGAGLHTDNRPRLEFTAPRNLYLRTLDQNYLFLSSRRVFDFGIVDMEPVPAKNLFFYQEVAAGMMAKKMHPETGELLKIADRIAPGDPRTSALQGILKMRLEKFDEAIELLERAVAADETLHEAHHALGEIYRKNHEKVKALGSARKAFSLRPDHEAYREGLAEALFMNESWDESLVLFREILERRAGWSFSTMTRIADIMIKAGTPDEIIQALKNIAGRYPRYPIVHRELGHRLEARNRLPESLESYKTYAALVPDDAKGYLNLARLYDKLGMRGPMIKAVREAVKHDPSLAGHPEIRKISAGS